MFTVKNCEIYENFRPQKYLAISYTVLPYASYNVQTLWLVNFEGGVNIFVDFVD